VDEHRLNDPLQILYQGRFAPDRGIETLLSSVRDWVPGRVLVLRGLGDAAYLERLRRLARPAGSTVRFDTPVDPGVLVSAASTADVGIHPIAGVTSQTALCLPNKFFEYVMAGLALCVSDVPEMRRVVEEHDLGWLIPEHSSTAIAATINAITPVDVSRFRANARSAAHALSWEIEGVRLIDAFGRIAS
jgi:glycosyltransferase involved in cell wall biosynthesis